MRTELGDFFRSRRTQLGFTLQDLARRLGYRNADKGARRLERLERQGGAKMALVHEAAAALGIGRQEVEALRARDEEAKRADFEAWLLEPTPRQLLGYAAGVTFELPLPEGLGEEEACSHAVAVQEGLRLRVCLVLDRRRSLWIATDGTRQIVATSLDRPNYPFTTVG